MLFGSFKYMYCILLDLLLFQFLLLSVPYVLLLLFFWQKHTLKFDYPLRIGIQEARFISSVGAEGREKWIQRTCPNC